MVAIGGITLEQCAAGDARAPTYAVVVGDVFGAADLAARARMYRALLNPHLPPDDLTRAVAPHLAEGLHAGRSHECMTRPSGTRGERACSAQVWRAALLRGKPPVQKMGTGCGFLLTACRA